MECEVRAVRVGGAGVDDPMSSTKRLREGSSAPARDAHPDDFYRTPAWAVKALIERLGAVPGPILEPGCGDGAILSVLEGFGLGPLVGVETNEARAIAADMLTQPSTAIHRLDFLGDRLEPVRARLPCSSISNPPFKHAVGFIQRTLEIIQPGGRAFFLLRLAFLAGQARARSGIWDDLAAVYVLPRRPSFTGRGTDSADYCWLEFSTSHRGPARLEHL